MSFKRLNERFVDAADWVSNAMGTPANILLWLIAVAIWFFAFATHPELQNSNFLPGWFTSSAFNFPLNSITTLAELYIGFLVAAAANRVERRNREMMQRQLDMEKKLDRHVNVTAKQHTKQIEENTKLTKEVHRLITENTALTQRVHDLLRASVAAPDAPAHISDAPIPTPEPPAPKPGRDARGRFVKREKASDAA